jgi:hypothetical protein
MNRLNLLLCLSMVACNVTVPPSNTPASTQGTTGPTNSNTNTTDDDKTAVCEGSTSSCSKFVKTCKNDCKSITDATAKKECNTACGEALEGCVEACKASDDPDLFDAETEDFDGKPEPPPTTSETCGNADQECCAEAGLDDCQAGLLKLTNTDADGNTVCGCVTPCKKNLADQANQGKDDCDATHICIPQDLSKPVSASNKLFCVPSMCDPATAVGDGKSIDPGCGFPQTTCSPVGKPTFGFCNFTCTPGSETMACPAGQSCYATYVTDKNSYIPANVCASKVTPAINNSTTQCTLTVTGAPATGYSATDNCGGGRMCDLKTDRCVKPCGVENQQTGAIGPSGGLCTGENSTTCSPIYSDIAGIPAPSGANATDWKAQGKEIAEQQGLMYECIAAQPL